MLGGDVGGSVRVRQSLSKGSVALPEFCAVLGLTVVRLVGVAFEVAGRAFAFGGLVVWGWGLRFKSSEASRFISKTARTAQRRSWCLW